MGITDGYGGCSAIRFLRRISRLRFHAMEAAEATLDLLSPSPAIT